MLSLWVMLRSLRSLMGFLSEDTLIIKSLISVAYPICWQRITTWSLPITTTTARVTWLQWKFSRRRRLSSIDKQTLVTLWRQQAGARLQYQDFLRSRRSTTFNRSTTTKHNVFRSMESILVSIDGGIDGSSGPWGQRISKSFGTAPVADKWWCSWNFPSFPTSFSPYPALQCSGISGLIHRGRWWC